MLTEFSIILFSFYGYALRIRNEEDRINHLFETDKKWSLTFTLGTDARAFIHSKDDITSLDFRPTIFWEKNTRIELLITMKQTYTTDDARQLTISQRKCIFSDEVKLTYFKDDMYTYSACMEECRLERSNKVPFISCFHFLHLSYIINPLFSTFAPFSSVNAFHRSICLSRKSIVNAEWKIFSAYGTMLPT